jgi:hypothetical protein
MVSTWKQTNSSTQTVLDYPLTVDGDFAVATRVADAFAPHAQATPNMTVALDPGFVFDPRNASLVAVAGQSSGTFTAPVSQPRIDRVVVDAGTGTVSVLTGTEAASPSAPALPLGKMPVAQVLLQTSTTSITNDAIIDERAVWGAPVPGVPWAIAAGSSDAITASYAPANAALYDGLLLSFRASAANATTTPTFAPDGLAAGTITKKGGQALVAGDIAGPLAECIVRYNAANVRWELLDPQSEFTLPVIANNDLLANTSGAAAEPVGTSLSALIDSAIGSTRGALLERGAASWALLPPGTSGNALLSNGAGADPSYGIVAKPGDNVSEFVNDAGYVTGAAGALNIGAGLANDGSGNLKALSALSQFNNPTTPAYTLVASDAGTLLGSGGSSGAALTVTLSNAMLPGSRIAFAQFNFRNFNIVIPDGFQIFADGGAIPGPTTISMAPGITNESMVLSFVAENLFFLESCSPLTLNHLGFSAFAPIASPVFTGTPTAPTPAAADNSTKIATTAFVDAAVAAIPAAAAATGQQQRFSSIVQSTSTAQVVASYVVLTNSATGASIAPAVNCTINTGATGLNGFDTGTIAASTLYRVWVVSNGTTTGAVLSLSSSAPNAAITGSFPFIACKGSVLTNASAQLITTIQRGSDVQLQAPIQLANPTSSGSAYVAVSLANHIPPDANKYKVSIALNTGFGHMAAAPNSNYPLVPTSTGTPPLFIDQVTSAINAVADCQEFVNETGEVFFNLNVDGTFSSAGLYLNGWTESV